MKARGVPLLAALACGGCGGAFDAARHDHSPATRPAVATDVDPERAEPEFWLAQSPAVNAVGHDYDKLWSAAEQVSHDYLFNVDRRDRRQGLMTTVPTVSAQWFEPWRRELQTSADVLESSTATLRRTIFWTFDHAAGRYAVTPKVLIERQSFAEKRVSGVLQRTYFRTDPHDPAYGNRELDQNVRLPGGYWYPVGRDFALEQRLVEKVQRKL